jgi:hypothetical protein
MEKKKWKQIGPFLESWHILIGTGTRIGIASEKIGAH